MKRYLKKYFTLFFFHLSSWRTFLESSYDTTFLLLNPKRKQMEATKQQSMQKYLALSIR